MYAERCNYIHTWVSDCRRLATHSCIIILAIGVYSAYEVLNRQSCDAPGCVPIGHEWIQYVSALGLFAAHLVHFTLFIMIILFVSSSSLALDSFVLEFLTASHIDGITGKFNVCNAVIRQSSYGIQNEVVVWALFATFSVILVLYDTFDQASDGFDISVQEALELLTHGVGQVLFSVGLLLYVLWQISVVNVKCRRLPAMFSTLNFGIEIDHDRSVVVNHIIASDIGWAKK